jgi:hypothetical protein
MTDIKSLLPEVSPYTVNESTFTTAMFNKYLTEATAVVNATASDSMPEAIRDKCTALFVAHFYEAKLGNIDVKSGDPGEWKWVQPGKTSWWIQAMEYIKMFGSAPATPNTAAEVQRADADMPALRMTDLGPFTPFT